MHREINIIDGNSWGYSSNYAAKLYSGTQETQAVFGFLKMIRELEVAYPRALKLVAWDGRAQWRFDMHPEYKSNRESDPTKKAFKESYVSQRPLIQRCLTHLGIRQVKVANQEADDIGGFLAGSFAKDPDTKVTVFTGDEDWLQMVRPNVSWRDWRDDAKHVTWDNFKAKTGYANPIAFLEGKCLVGDTSDVIKGIDQIGDKRAVELLERFGSVREFWRQVEAGEFVPTRIYEKNLAAPNAREIFLKNMRLMQLIKPPTPQPDQTTNIRGRFDKEAFADLCEELAFVSILKSLDKFTQPFEG